MQVGGFDCNVVGSSGTCSSTSNLHVLTFYSTYNYLAGAGGALKLSGTVEMSNVTFGRNSATSEGPAISNIGDIENMSFVSFVGNHFTCSAGEFLEFVEVGEIKWCISRVFPGTTSMMSSPGLIPQMPTVCVPEYGALT